MHAIIRQHQSLSCCTYVGGNKKRFYILYHFWIFRWLENLKSFHLEHMDLLLLHHYSDVIMSVMTSQIAGVSFVYSTVCSGKVKKNIKAPHHWPLWGEFTSDQWIPCTKGQLSGNVSIWWHNHDCQWFGARAPWSGLPQFQYNKANLRDLIAATGLVILLKCDPNHRFFSPCDVEIWC